MPSITNRKINKEQGQLATKKLHTETSKLNPSALLTFYEIDISELLFDRGFIIETDDAGRNAAQERRSIFRFHNNISLTHSDIIWQGNQYIALPIKGEGFTYTGVGTLPTPKITLSTNEEGIEALSLLKCQIEVLGEIVGAKVTRIKTFLKHIDKVNFLYDEQNNEYGIQPPDDYDPDPNVEFPREVFYIERKVADNKYVLEFELASILDVENVKLPGRTVYANRCLWNYRGQGCCYEFPSIWGRKSPLHNDVPDSFMGKNGIAPPVATITDHTFKQELGIDYTQLNGQQLLVYDKGKWDKTKTYLKKEYVFLTKNNINYYYVAKKNVPSNTPPPNNEYWIPEQCSKSIFACQLRYGRVEIGDNGQYISEQALPFGGFPGADKLG